MNAMINCEDRSFLSSNGRTQIHLKIWLPDTEPMATMQIAHGVAGHCDRFDGMASFLAERGITVLANDHLGHGKSITDPSERGFFDENDGWMKVVEDMHTVYALTCGRFPSVPHFLLGHSMGSFLARTYLFTWPNDFDGVLLAGTGHQRRAVLRIGRLLAGGLAAVSPKGRSKVLYRSVSASYNRCFRPARTAYDWLTRDEAAVDEFLRDPTCGFACTNRLYADMMQGLLMITDRKNMEKMDKEKPVLFYSGTMDPVGENGAGVRRAFEAFRSCGMRDVELKLYEGGRHEMHNELNRQEVFDDILAWTEEKIRKTQGG